MRARTDPLFPILATVVGLVVLGAVMLIFVPRVSHWLEAGRAPVVGRPPDPNETVPVWVARTDDGVAMLLEADAAEGSGEPLGRALEGGPWHYLSLWVFNFEREQPVDFRLPDGGYTSPEGGPAARPAAAVLRREVPGHLVPILRGLGAVSGLEIAKGHFGRFLLVLANDPARRTAFVVNGSLRLERREVERGRLASWLESPDWTRFREFQ